MNVKRAVPFLGVTDMRRSLAWWVDAVGFRMTLSWPDEEDIRWCWLEHGGAAVMLQEFRRESGERWKPEGKLGQGVVICFMCEDALAIYREVRGRGVQASRPFVGNGMWNTELHDPDGYSLQFESLTDVPEETEYEGPAV